MSSKLDKRAFTESLLDLIRGRVAEQRVQMDLFYDYQTNVNLSPQWQAYLREHQPPTLVAWGATDPIFVPAGPEAYKRDLKEIDFPLFYTGKFVSKGSTIQAIKKVVSYCGTHNNEDLYC